MIDYIKDAWKISGSLKKSKYLSLASILWTVFLGFILIMTLGMLNTIFTPDLGTTFSNIIMAIIFFALLIIVWVINIRFYPFAFKKFNFKTKGIINSSVEEYRRVRDAGPRTMVKRPYDSSNVDFLVERDWQGKFKGYKDNRPQEYQESKASQYHHAISEGFEAGYASFAQMLMGGFFKLCFWPIAFISGLANMGPVVHEYRKAQENNSNNLQ